MSWFRRLFPRTLVVYCSSCHNPVKGDLEARRRSARRCSSYVECCGQLRTEPFNGLCIRLMVVWG